MIYSNNIIERKIFVTNNSKKVYISPQIEIVNYDVSINIADPSGVENGGTDNDGTNWGDINWF